MSTAAQVSAFCRDVTKKRKIWTIRFPDESYIKWQNEDGSEVFPIWSTETRVQRILQCEEAFLDGEAVCFSFEEFLAGWLPKLKKKSVGLGPNWVGDNLSGWSFRAEELIERVKTTPGFEEK